MRPPKQSGKYGARQIAEAANGIIDPLLAKRAGISSALLAGWDDIVGESFADCTRPEKIAWDRRVSETGNGGGYQPGTLIIACEGARALFLTHAQGDLIGRINSFFGFPAIRQIRIVQKPVSAAPVRRPLPALRGEAARKLGDMMEGIEDDKLRQAIERLGRGVLAKRRR